MAVKKNQKTLHADISDFFEASLKNSFKHVAHEYYEEHYKGHGRIESRRYWLSPVLETVENVAQWTGLKSIAMAESERNIDGVITIECRYFISSLDSNVKDFAEAVRKHWAIENKLHWVLDVTFREDDSRARRDNAAENLAVFRHVAINALRNDKTDKKGIKAKRYKAALMPDYSEKILNVIF